MKVTNRSNQRVRLTQPACWIEPGETVEVPDEYGAGLLAQMPDFVDHVHLQAKKDKAPKSEPTAPDGIGNPKESD